MPRQRQYETAADRQAAYRKRRDEARLGQQRATPSKLSVHRWRKEIMAAHTLLGTVEQEMNAYYDERSETWKDGETGETFQERLDALSEVHEQIENLLTDW